MSVLLECFRINILWLNIILLVEKLFDEWIYNLEYEY
jgi:hypothetical protein